MENYQIIKGGVFADTRGKIFHVNTFDMSEVKRFYTVENTISKPLRAWQGHQKERKWFYVVNGTFLIGLVEPNDWSNPDRNLPIYKIILTAEESNILFIPPGYANGIKALTENAKMMVFSNFTIDQGAEDNVKFDLNTWQL